nr:alkaline phosphatase family protein [uncultured Ralstonia sp.]
MTEEQSPEYFRTRRRLIGAAAATLAGAGLSACGGGGADGTGNSSNSSGPANATPSPTPAPAPASSALVPPVLPDPQQAGIDHVVMVVMENRSFDHYFGWLPGADGKQAGLQFTDAFGNLQNTFRLATEPKYGFQGCGFADPDHSYEGGRTQLNGGKMDGWLRTADTNKTPGDLFPIGYYLAEDLSFFGPAAQHWTVCDQYHCGILAETYPNRFHLMCGETDRLHNSNATCQLPTIFDRCAEKGVSANYYFSDVPFTALFGNKYLGISKPFGSFLTDAAAGRLPAFSYVDPRFTGENPQGISADDHPNSDIRNGQAFLNQIYDAVRNGPGWQKTLMVITYDEWGGFFDHVPPFKRPISAAESLLGNDGYVGFRVPMVLIGPRVRRGHVSHWPLDPSSIHAFLAWRFGLNSLGARGGLRETNSIAYALDFTSPLNLAAPAISVPQGPFGGLCPGSVTGSVPGVNGISGVPGMHELRTIASALGFPLP